MWKALLLATVATISVASAAEKETIYVRPNSTFHWQSPTPFKSIIVGGAYGEEKDNIVSASSHGSNVDVYLNIKDPKNWIGGTNVFLLDEKGLVIVELNVVITPTGRPMHPIHIYRNGGYTTYLMCNDGSCGPYIGPKPKDPTAETTTRSPDGSVSTRREY